jgi:hypothetical protein
MTVEAGLRDPSVTREELRDLLNYLNGLPEGIRRTGAFAAYEQRVGELSRELVLNDLRLFAFHLPNEDLCEPATTSTNEYVQMYERLSKVTHRYEHTAAQSLKASHAFQWGMVAASVCTVLSALTMHPLVVPLGIVTALAGIYVFWLAGRARKHEQAATRLSVLREQISHTFGPAGEVLGPSEYYPASTKRIESLLDEMKATVSNGHAI